MSRNNPYSTLDDDKTIIRPSPGGRRYRTPAAPPLSRSVDRFVDTDVASDFSVHTNPFCTHAFSILSLVPKLRKLPYHHTINELQERLIKEIKDFENRLSASGCTEEQVRIASYFLCSLTDETILNTPWGSQSNWGHHGLLIRFHKEAQGGEGFYLIVKQLLEKPEHNIDLLEFAYICMSLGFEGKYRLEADGLRVLEQQRQELYALIRRVKGGAEGELSRQWQGLQDIRNPLMRNIPLWVILTIAGLLIVLIYLAFVYKINRDSNSVYQQLSRIAQKQMQTPRIRPENRTTPIIVPSEPDSPVPTGSSPSIERYRQLLADEIVQKKVDVLEGPTLRISGAFPSGSEQIKKEFLPMLEKIAQYLQQDGVYILVVGHTDNTPIFSARFPSNWHLSDARARSVAKILASNASLGKRIRYEGRADSEPVVSNDTPENRALNRRIDIHFR